MKMLEKLQKRLQEGKKDNKGFSLVELIIVIAIMAILIGIVGMNVIPQIENARKATDAQVLSAMVSEAMEAWTQVNNAAGTSVITINVDSNGKLTLASVKTGGADDADLQSAFEDLAKLDTRELKSNAGKALGTGGIVIHCDGTDGVYITGKAGDDGSYPENGKLTDFDGYEFKSR